MADKPISVGDLIAVVKWPCCGTYVGFIRTVNGFANLTTPTCHVCLTRGPLGMYVTLSGAGQAPVEWVKRIPPLDEMESEKRDEEITA